MLCRRTARLQVRCAPVGDVGAVSRVLWLAAEPHRYGRALCALDLAGGGSLFPLNNIVFAPSQKHLMRLARIKRAYYVRTRAAHVRREGGGG